MNSRDRFQDPNFQIWVSFGTGSRSAYCCSADCYCWLLNCWLLTASGLRQSAVLFIYKKDVSQQSAVAVSSSKSADCRLLSLQVCASPVDKDSCNAAPLKLEHRFGWGTSSTECLECHQACCSSHPVR